MLTITNKDYEKAYDYATEVVIDTWQGAFDEWGGFEEWAGDVLVDFIDAFLDKIGVKIN